MLNDNSKIWERNPFYAVKPAGPEPQPLVFDKLFMTRESLAQELANVPGTTNLRSPARRDDLYLIEQSVIADEK